MRGSILVPPLVFATLVCAMLSWLLGGAIWLWLVVGWIAAAPLTLLWAVWLSQPRERRAEQPGRAYKSSKIGVTGHHPAGR